MNKFSLSLITFAISATAANAGGYGVCGQQINKEFKSIIAPVQPVKSVTHISENTLVLLIEGLPELGESIVPVRKEHFSELHSALSTPTYSDVWIGIIEVVDGNQNPALWMRVWVNTKDGCVVSAVDNRVFEKRGNAPSIFDDAIYDWEKVHPSNALIYPQ